jgi:hypothetical protein
MRLIFVGLGALLILFSAVNPAHAQWYFQIVDAAGDVGYYSQIAVTSDGTPYILYRNYGDNVFLTWPVKPGGFWDRMQIASGDSYYFYALSVEIICDSSDNLHLAYPTSGGFDYAIVSSQTRDFILPPENVTSDPGFLDLAIAENAGTITPAIVYSYYGSPGELRVAARNPSTGVWSIETIYTGVVISPSITADATGYFHISFFESAGDNLMYATNAPDNVWGSQVVDVAGDVGQYSSIVIDADGYPCIAYYDATNGNLKYAKMVAH